MGTWAEIRDGMKARLATISGLQAYDITPNKVADKDVAIVVYGEPVAFEPSAHARKVDVHIRVVVRVQRGNIEDMQDAMDAYLWPTGTDSIIAAVDGDRTLGNKVDDTQWQGTGSVGTVGATNEALQATIDFRCKVTA